MAEGKTPGDRAAGGRAGAARGGRPLRDRLRPRADRDGSRGHGGPLAAGERRPVPHHRAHAGRTAGHDAPEAHPSRGRRSRRGLPARAPRRPDSQLPGREALPPCLGPLRLGAVDRVARPRRPGPAPLRRLPGPGHLRPEGAVATPRVPDRSRLPDRALQPAALRAGAGAGGRAGGPLRSTRRRAHDRPGQLQGRQRHLRTQGGRRPSEGRGRRREASHPPHGPPGEARRGRVRCAPPPGRRRPGAGRGGRDRQGAGSARGRARGPIDPGHRQRRARHVREPLRGRRPGLRRRGHVRGQGGGPKPVCALQPRPGTAGTAFGAADRSGAPSHGAPGRPLHPVRPADPRPAGRRRSTVRGPAAPPRRRGRRAAHTQHVPVRRRALRPDPGHRLLGHVPGDRAHRRERARRPPARAARQHLGQVHRRSQGGGRSPRAP